MEATGLEPVTSRSELFCQNQGPALRVFARIKQKSRNHLDYAEEET